MTGEAKFRTTGFSATDACLNHIYQNWQIQMVIHKFNQSSSASVFVLGCFPPVCEAEQQAAAEREQEGESAGRQGCKDEAG